MNDINTILTEDEIAELQMLASEKRTSLFYSNNVPVANGLPMILDKLNIHLLEYPIKSLNGCNAFSAVILCNRINGRKYTFMGINSANSLTEQCFDIAHELYHFFTDNGIKSCSEQENKRDEAKANRFAAEFLLPETALKRILLDEFNKTSLHDIDIFVLIRLIARIHCNWWFPYVAIVRRLFETQAISQKQSDALLFPDNNDYYKYFERICHALDSDTFLKLNTPTNKIGISPKNIEIIIKNYENDLIDDNTFIKVLNMFNIDPASFGYDFEICDDDYNELEEVLEEVDS